MAQFKRITKTQAKKLFAAGDKGFYLCPCKLSPCSPGNVACLVFGREYLERAKEKNSSDSIWKGSVEETAWGLLYNNWAYYNTSPEAGTYAHYYVTI